MNPHEGSVSIEDGGTQYKGRWESKHGIVSLYVAGPEGTEVGPISTYSTPGSGGQESIARGLLREYISGCNARR